MGRAYLGAIQKHIPMRITVPTKWSELSEWQLSELAHLFLSDTDLGTKTLEIVSILFKANNSIKQQLKYARLINEAPLSSLRSYLHFLVETPDLYKFPNLSKYGVDTPGDRLNTISVKQFSVVDAIFYSWRKSKKEIHLRQLIAALYTINQSFDVLELPNVAERTDNVPIKTMYAVGLTYLSVRNSIVKAYPTIFPAPTDEDETDKPVFRKKNDYTPFSKVIQTIVFDERKPLGNLHECNQTNIYDFLNTLQELIIRFNNKKV